MIDLRCKTSYEGWCTVVENYYRKARVEVASSLMTVEALQGNSSQNNQRPCSVVNQNEK